MTTRVITFLGIYPKNTVYEYQGKTYEGNLFQIALRQFLDFDEMDVFVTPDAESNFNENLKPLNDPRIQMINIRTGRTSEGLWNIFNAVVKTVNNGDTVIFDITHGLRSIPFLTFLVAAYLRSATSVTIKSVLYGAFELGQPAPVIDLSEFVELLDWLTATERFTQTGNAAELAALLRKNREPALEQLAETVETIATGLHLLRPKETSGAAAKLPESLKYAYNQLPPPFIVLANKIETNYSRFGLKDHRTDRDQLIYELEMVNWYHQRGQIVHALSMAREWVVSFLCVHFGLDTTDWQARNEMEFLIGGGKKKDQETKKVIRESPYLQQWGTIPQGKRLRKLWVKNSGYELADLRNDVLHSGFRKKPKPSKELKTLVDNAITELNRIAAEIGFVEHTIFARENTPEQPQ